MLSGGDGDEPLKIPSKTVDEKRLSYRIPIANDFSEDWSLGAGYVVGKVVMDDPNNKVYDLSEILAEMEERGEEED